MYYLGSIHIVNIVNQDEHIEASLWLCRVLRDYTKPIHSSNLLLPPKVTSRQAGLVSDVAQDLRVIARDDISRRE